MVYSATDADYRANQLEDDLRAYFDVLSTYIEDVLRLELRLEHIGVLLLGLQLVARRVPSGLRLRQPLFRPRRELFLPYRRRRSVRRCNRVRRLRQLGRIHRVRLLCVGDAVAPGDGASWRAAPDGADGAVAERDLLAFRAHRHRVRPGAALFGAGARVRRVRGHSDLRSGPVYPGATHVAAARAATNCRLALLGVRDAVAPGDGASWGAAPDGADGAVAERDRSTGSAFGHRVRPGATVVGAGAWVRSVQSSASLARSDRASAAREALSSASSSASRDC